MKNRITQFLPSLTFSSPFLTFLFPLFLTFLTLLAHSSAFAQIPSNGLVGYWPFNGNANDESGNGNNGTVNGATLTTDRFGNANSAYSFSNNLITIPHNSSLGIQQNEMQSVSAWIKVTGSQSVQHIMGKRPSGNQQFNWQILFNNPANQGLGYTGNINFTDTGVITNYTPQQNSWYHIVGIYNNGVWSFYVNGVLINTVTTGLFYPDVNCSLTFGNSGSFQPFYGLLDDVAIYDRALTPAEITQIYTSQTSTVAIPQTPSCPTLATNLQNGLVGYWPFCGNANNELNLSETSIVNGATLAQDRFGQNDKCYYFNGISDEIITGNYGVAGTGISVSFWYKTSQLSANNYMICWGGNSWSSYFEIINNHWSAQTAGPCYTPSLTGGGTLISKGLTVSPDENAWHHCVVILPSGAQSFNDAKFYFDNVALVETCSYANYGAGAPNITSINPIKFGSGYQQGWPTNFEGFLDDIGVWNRELTVSEISQIYNTQSTPPLSCTPFLGEDQTVCAGTSVTLNASSAPSSVAACQTLPTNLQTGLVGYWPFCGNANDASGNGNNGTVNGATLTTDRFGNANSAYSFDGVNDLIGMNNSNISPSAFTLSGWYSTPVVQEQSIYYQGGQEFHFGEFAASNNLMAGVKCPNDTWYFTNHVSLYPTLNQWTHFSVSFAQGGKLKLYLNGNLVDSSLVVPCSNFFFPGLYSALGSYNGSSRWFSGKLDDIVIHNRALSSSEIQQLYSLGQSTYLWSNGATTASISVTPTQTTTYTCTVTDANGNACTDSVTVVVPQITATNSTICAGQSTTLSVTGINSTATPSACPTLPSSLQTGLVGYWPFCGNANDASGNGNNGTVNGATLTTDRFGNANSAYSFDGNDNINSGNSSAFNITTDYSISFWYNQNTIDMGAILSKDNGGGNQNKYVIGTNQYGTNGDFLHWHRNTETVGQWRYTGIPVGSSWNFVLWRFTPSNIELYRNGVLFQTYTYGVPLPLNITADLIFGSAEGGFYYQGKIDDICFFNRALSASEIQQLYSLGQTTYLWSNGATSPTINVSPTTTTTYTCTVTTNGVSCTNSFTVVVNNPTVNLGSDVTACGTSTTLTAPTGYDSYSWSNGGTTNTTTVAANGTYTCTVTQGGCTASDAVDVTLINATISATDSVVCAGETTTLSVNAIPGSTFNSILFPNPVEFNGHSYSKYVGTANWFNAKIICESNGGYLAIPNSVAESDFIQSLSGINEPGTWIGITDQASEGAWMDVQGNPVTFFNWAPGEPNNAGNEDFVYIYDQVIGSGRWNDLTPFYNNPFVMELNSMPLEILWSNGETTPTINVSPTITTTYTCTVTTNGVSCTDTVTVVVSNPTINLGSDVTACGTSTTLTAPTGYDSYAWSNGGTTNTTTVNANGTYTCTVTQGACSASDAVDVTLINATISVTDSIICAGETTTLSVNAIPNSTFNSILFPNPVEFNGHYYSKYVGTANWFNAKSICESSGGYLAIPNSVAESDFIQSLSGINEPGTWIGITDQASEGAWMDVQGNPVTFFYWFPGEPNNVGDEDFACVYNQTTGQKKWNDLQPSYLLPFVMETNSMPSGILWSNGATSPTINVSPTTTTTYTCTVTTNGVSCTNSFTVVVNNPTVNLGSDVTACGTSTTLTAPTGYDSYSWSNGGTTNTTTVTSNGTYTCTVYEGGCSASDAVDVTLVNSTISATDSIICVGETTTLSVPQGGSSNTGCSALPTNLQTGLVGYWPFCGNANDESGNGNNGTVNGATLTSDRFGNASSAYSFDGVNDVIQFGDLNYINAGVPGEFSISIWLNINQFNTDLGGGQCMLFGDEISQNNGTLLQVSTTNGFGSYTAGSSGWYCGCFPNLNNWIYYTVVQDQSGQKLFINGELWGQLTSLQNSEVSAIVRMGLFDGCSGPCQRPLNGKLDDVSLYNRALSASEIQQLYILGQTTYLWSNGATSPTINVSPTTTTTYTCTVTTNGVSCTDTITVVVGNPVASITPNGIVEICQGQSISLTGNGGVSYLWNTGAPTQSISVNTEAVYTVTVTDANGCTDTESQLVKVNFLPNIGVNNAAICPGQSATLTANGGVNYAWSPATGLSATIGSTVTASPATSTLYTVTGTGANGCTNTATAAVAVNALPTATITPATATTFCQGGSVVLNSNTGTGLMYQWFNNATAISGATSASYTATTSGSYTVVVTNASTCSSTSTATVVTVNALPTATITPATATTFCQGGSVVLNANTGTGLSYQWRLNGNPISGATSASYTATTSGSYTVVVTNASACSSTSTATVVTVNALPTATITPATATTFCQGGSVVLNANTGTGLSYQWKLNGTNITGATSSSYTANASGSYTVVVTNASTCSATSTATVVTVNALPIATITPATATTFCQGGSVVLNANTGTGLTYQWFNNATAISGATSSSYTANASGSYTVTVTNASTCSSTSTAVVVTTIPNVDYFADNDGDGFGDATTLISTCIQPQGYVADNTDCDDNDATVNTAATEVCNHIDDDCNGLIDDGITFNTYYADNDGDGFGDANNSIYECSQPAGYVTNNTDCNDNNLNQNAASAEICNGEDDDCDGTIDNGLVFLDYYADLDSDGFGAGAATNSCVDLGAGYVTNNADCNNANASINPNAIEICNSIDDNCDGQIDEGITFTTYYQDFDNDGFGTGDAVTSCTNPGAGWVTNNTDCDDTNGNTFPGATELCNTIDDNCDGQTDEGVQTVYFIDNDGDTYGNPSVSILACTQPIGYTPDDNDCNDTDASINPGAEDIGGNGIDENCDGEIDNSIFELNATINLYPNPTRSELNIQISSALVGNEMYIFDAVGKLVYKQQLLSTQTTLSMSEYADGNYIFRVGEVVKRFEVMK